MLASEMASKLEPCEVTPEDGTHRDGQKPTSALEGHQRTDLLHHGVLPVLEPRVQHPQCVVHLQTDRLHHVGLVAPGRRALQLVPSPFPRYHFAGQTVQRHGHVRAHVQVLAQQLQPRAARHGAEVGLDRVQHRLQEVEVLHGGNAAPARLADAHEHGARADTGVHHAHDPAELPNGRGDSLHRHLEVHHGALGASDHHAVLHVLDAGAEVAAEDLDAGAAFDGAAGRPELKQSLRWGLVALTDVITGVLQSASVAFWPSGQCSLK